MCIGDNSTVRQRNNRLTTTAKAVDDVPALEKSESQDDSSQTSSPTNSPKNQTHQDAKIGSGYIVTAEPSIGEKLFQAKEDKMYAHKIIGFSVLASYIYRFSNLGENDGNLAWMTIPFVLHHLALNLTSFIFDIPKRRVKTGFRIWPEYRIHSLVFTARNLACMVRLWMLTQFLNPNSYAYTACDNGLANWLIVMITCATADYGSSLSAEFKSNTVRGTDYFDPYANWFASEMQFQLTAVCLSAGYQRYSLHLVGAFVIQFNSFLMTLRRKNVFSHLTLTTTYGLMLGAALLIGTYEDFYTNDQITRATAFANLGILLRMGLGVDKYVVWTILAAGMHIMEQGLWRKSPALALIGSQLPEDSFFYWTIVFWIGKFLCFGLGLRKRSQKLAKRGNEKGEVSLIVPLAVGSVLVGLCTFDMLDIFGLLD